MGTHGYFGFHYKRKYYLFYNHWDSYPSYLGVKILNKLINTIKNNKLDYWKNKIDEIKIVSKTDIPAREDIEKLSIYTDLNVGKKSTNDWYCLLRKTQGDLDLVIESGYYVDNNFESSVTSFVEYVYYIDLDNEEFVWKTNFGPKNTCNFDINELTKLTIFFAELY